MAFTLPNLGYAYDALEPHIDTKTMEIHHTKHHQAYVNNANAALEGVNIGDKSVEALLADLSAVPADKKQAVINNAGGHANHSLFWNLLTPGGAKAPKGDVAKAIDSTFSNFDKFKEEFAKAATTRFGSGWAWLVQDKGAIKIISTANQDSPIMSGQCPILGLDVWEHAYYLKYQNRRPDYIAAFWNAVNWDKVATHFAQAKK